MFGQWSFIQNPSLVGRIVSDPVSDLGVVALYRVKCELGHLSSLFTFIVLAGGRVYVLQAFAMLQ